ncbi:MAG: hypothetical protein ACPGJV_14780 [Bacteriovoracaceae bacterium]
MKITGKKIQKDISQRLEKGRRLPNHLYYHLELMREEVDENKEYDLTEFIIYNMIRAQDLNFVSAVGDLLSCLNWDALEFVDDKTLYEIGKFFKNSSKEK